MKFHNFIAEAEGWETLREEVKYADPYLVVRELEVRTPGRSEPRSWSVVHRKAAVVVAPMTADGQLLLVRQERIPIRAAIWEFPAGQIDEAAEHDEAMVRATGLRELREETGHELSAGGELVAMGHFFSSAGFTDEHSYLFFARPVAPHAGGVCHDANEVITECRAFDVAAVRKMIAANEICDANTLCAFARMTALGLL